MRRLLSLIGLLLTLVGAGCSTNSGDAPSATIPAPPVANRQRGVPTSLFGVELGRAYKLGKKVGDTGELPVKAIRAMQKFTGEGIHIYFQPLEDNIAFPYEERPKKNPTDKFFETSFRLYVLPVIPPSVTTLKQLDELDLPWEVTTIEWSAEAESAAVSHYWAKDLCETFSVDISVKPTILESPPEGTRDIFRCTFAADGRELNIFNIGGARKYLSLTFDKNTDDAKQSATETARRKLEANAIRPYR